MATKSMPTETDGGRDAAPVVVTYQCGRCGREIAIPTACGACPTCGAVTFLDGTWMEAPRVEHHDFAAWFQQHTVCESCARLTAQLAEARAALAAAVDAARREGTTAVVPGQFATEETAPEIMHPPAVWHERALQAEATLAQQQAEHARQQARIAELEQTHRRLVDAVQKRLAQAEATLHSTDDVSPSAKRSAVVRRDVLQWLLRDAGIEAARKEQPE